jgi:membrane-associated protease RseP (regulator of RpoE activity)
MTLRRKLVLVGLTAVMAISAVSVALAQGRGGPKSPRDPIPARVQDGPRLGVTLQAGSLTVTEVLEGSPAAAAGLQVGDTIVAVNGSGVSSAPAVVRALAQASRANNGAETPVTVTVIRDGSSVDLTATLPAFDFSTRFPRMAGIMGMLLQPKAAGDGYNLVIPFTLSEGAALTDDAAAALSALGWTVEPVEGEDGVYQLLIPAETVRSGLAAGMDFDFNFDAMPGLNGLRGLRGLRGQQVTPPTPEAPAAEATPQA